MDEATVQPAVMEKVSEKNNAGSTDKIKTNLHNTVDNHHNRTDLWGYQIKVKALKNYLGGNPTQIKVIVKEGE